MARVLCINPWIVDFAAYNSWIEPLGLLSVAAVLRAAGHDVALIDCLDRHHPAAPAPTSPHDAFGCGHFAKVELHKPPVLAHVPRRWGRYGLPVEVFDAELAAQPRPAAVLVTSGMTYWYPGVFEAIRHVRAQWPDVPLALGGIYATLCADHAREHAGADVVISGPGEEKALRWVNEISGEARPMPTGWDDPLPAHDLRRPQGYVTVRTTRGCPFHCPYCAVHELWPGPFTPRAPARVVDEIAWCAQALGARDVAFYDDALLGDAERHFQPILEGLIERRLDVRLHAPNGLHARLVTPALASLMRRAGVVALRLGLETSDPDQQRRDGGKVDDASFEQAVRALWEAGFGPREAAAYVLVGRPGQDVEGVSRTVEFAYQLGIPVLPLEYSPIPATPEWQAAVAAGCIAADADPLLHNNSAYPCADAAAWEALKVRIRAYNRAIISRP